MEEVGGCVVEGGLGYGLARAHHTIEANTAACDWSTPHQKGHSYFNVCFTLHTFYTFSNKDIR